MLRIKFLLFILWFSVFNIIANDLENYNDSSYIGMYGELEEFTVQSDAVIQKVDKQVLLPSADVKKASANGIALLRNMALPRIVVNAMDNSVSTSSGDGVQLRINSVVATKDEVLSLNLEYVGWIYTFVLYNDGRMYRDISYEGADMVKRVTRYDLDEKQMEAVIAYLEEVSADMTLMSQSD